MKHYAKSQARFTTPAIIIASIFLAGLLLWSWSRIVATQAPQPAISFTHNSLARSVAFSPDRALLASGSWGANNSDAGEVKVWDTRSGALLHTLKGHTSFVNCAAFSPDGRVLASGGEDKAIKLWNAQTGKLRGTLQADYRVMSMTFSPDSKTR